MDTASITVRMEQVALLKNLLFSQELHLRDRDYLHRLFPQYRP
jgi:hypothetical protein